MIEKLNYIFDKKQKSRIVLLLIIILIGTGLELVGVTAILPFINIVMYPGTIELMRYWGTIYRFLHMESPTQFIILFAIALIIIYIIKNIYISIMYELQYRFVYNNQRRLATRILGSYMREPYSFHLEHNSAELMRNVNTDTDMLFKAVFGTLQFLTETCVCFVLVVYLLFLDKTITIGVTLFVMVFGFIFYKIYKKKLEITAQESRVYQSGMTKWLQQSFGGVKEIKVMGREEYFLGQYDWNYRGYADSMHIYMFMQVLPRPIMEALCVSALLSVVALKLANGVDSQYFVSTLSVFAIAAFRLLPSFNRITGNLSIIMFNKVSVDAVYHDLKEIEEIVSTHEEQTEDRKELQLREVIKIRHLMFRYPNVEQYVLNDVSLDIPKNKSIAFIGPSGAGKTTLADIILGVLTPESGSVVADEVDIFKNLELWHKTIGYIPQVIYLMDDTIRNNIVFGTLENEIDENRIISVLKEAQLEEFVMSLEGGLDTVIGERGVRLSGGQRQRIGIARALYTNPEVLVLDEATSALDNDTEKAVMEAIDQLSNSKTLIIIAHRLTTIQNCDLVYEIKNNQVEQKTRQGDGTWK